MPDFADNQTEASVVSELTALAQDVRLTAVEGVPFLGVPAGVELTDLERLLPAPKRLKAHLTFEAWDSFAVYVNTYKAPFTLLVSDRKADKVTAHIDYHGVGQPSWCDHQATLALKLHEDFTAWKSLGGRQISQVEFAEFVEDHMHNIGSPDGATLKEMVLKFQVLKDVTFKSVVNLENGDVNLAYIEDSERGTENRSKFPTELKLALPVYEGQEAIAVTARIRYRVRDAKLAFNVELVRKTELMRGAFEDILASIGEGTGLKVLRGA